MKYSPKARTRAGLNAQRFTLIELLVVIAIIMILAALLMPALSKVRYRATNLLCLNNMKELSVGVIISAGDNDTHYPDRGIFSGRLYDSYDRWAFRRRFGSAGKYIDQVLDEYVARDIPTWTCPLYQGRGKPGNYNGTTCNAGGQYGCTVHGVAHSGNEMTYSIHAGVKKWEIGDRDDGSNDAGGRGVDCWAATDHVLKTGDPFEVDNKGTKAVSNVMISHQAGYYRNSWVPSVNWRATGTGTIHMPPPGTNWGFWSGKISPIAELNVYGMTVENWVFNDGSGRIINTPMSLTSSEYVYIDNLWMYPYH